MVNAQGVGVVEVLSQERHPNDTQLPDSLELRTAPGALMPEAYKALRSSGLNLAYPRRLD